MGKNNRQRRAEKQRRKLKKQKNKTIENNNSKNAYPFSTKPFSPFLNVSEDNRKMIIEEMQKTFKIQYEESLKKITTILNEYNPIILLSMLSNYTLTVGMGENGIVNPKYREINQAQVEILQALILQIEVSKLKGLKPPPPAIYQEFQDTLIKLFEAISFRWLRVEKLNLDDYELSISQIQDFVRLHTQTVRNWGHFSQVKNISLELYSNFDEILNEKYNFSATNLIHFFEFLFEETEKNTNNRFKLLKELFAIKDIKKIAYKFHEIIGKTDKEAEDFISYIFKNKLTKEDVMLIVMSYYDLQISKNYVFNIHNIASNMDIDITVIKSILDKFSYKFGELKNEKTEYIYLSNPIWTKPIIKLDEKHFFCPIPQLFFSFIFDSFNNLIEKVDKVLLSEIKTKFLENKIKDIVKTRFPKANIVKSIEWKYNKSTQYETDLIAFIDSCLIIIEAKSGKIDKSTLRGSPDRLKRDIENLLVAPNIQSKRLKNKIEYLIKNPKQEDILREKLPINLNKIHKILRVSVTLEYFASLQSNIKNLEDTNWLMDDFEPCPTMNIADFETIFDILEHPVEIINYLELREKVESTVEYKGDELDLLGYYIDYHLNFPVIEENHKFMISGISMKIDNYYDSKNAGITLLKPQTKIIKLFQSIIKQLETRKIDRWTEIGTILYSFLPKDQNKIASSIFKLKNNIRKNWKKEGHENTLIYVPPLNTEYALCYVVYNNENIEKRYDFIEYAVSTALENEHIKYCLAIGKNIDDDNAYSLITLYE